jgi:hypothetical protein
MALNTEKYINVYYNKGDRKPYDVNGKPIAYLGQDYVGANEATIIRFYIGDNTGVTQAVADVKRADGEKAFLLMSPITVGTQVFYELPLTDWHTAKVGKLVVAFKGYNGAITIVDGLIQANNLRVIVSDIFNIDIGYSPNSVEETPPFNPNDMSAIIAALSAKLNVADGINVVQALPTPIDNSLNGRWYLVKSGSPESIGKLFVFNNNSAVEVELGTGQFNFSTTGLTTDALTAGQVRYNDTTGSLDLGLKGSHTLKLGEVLVKRVRNDDASSLKVGQLVYVYGAVGNSGLLLVKKATNIGESTSSKTFGMVATAMNTSSAKDGYVYLYGLLQGVDLTDGDIAEGSFVSGDVGSQLWLGENGKITKTLPTADNKHSVFVGYLDSFAGAGSNCSIYTKIQNGYEIGELHDVRISAVADNQILRYNSTRQVWENTSELTTAETDIDALEVRMTTEEGNVDSLEGRMTTAEGDIDDIEDGTTIVPKANADKDNNEFDATYLKKASATATYIPLSQKGVANGVAPLDSGGKVPSIHLPGGVDDIKEFADVASFPLVGEASIIYVALDTNIIYRWSGSAYTEISSSLALGETSSTAHRGDLGKIAYDHSQIITGNPHGTIASDVGAEPANANIQTTVTTVGNIINGSQTLTDTRITNSAVGVVPLIVDTVASNTANILELKQTGTNRFVLDRFGGLAISGSLFSTAGVTSAFISPSSTGTTIGRNINDTNVPLIVRKQLGTGNILELQTGTSDKKFEIDVNGHFFQNGTRLFHTTAGTLNIFAGVGAGNLTLTGVSNTGFGSDALDATTSGGNNTAVGRNALGGLTTGSTNTGVGSGSLLNVVGGGSNTAIGRQSGFQITSGNNNTFLGVDTGVNVLQKIDALNSTAIGFEAYTTANNQMVFGNASVAEFKFDRNASAVALLPLITASSGDEHSLERTTTGTASAVNPLLLRATSTNDMVDGFGSRITFQIRDNAGVTNSIARIGALRSGADNSGRLIFNTFTTGTDTEKMTILPDGKVGIGTSAPASQLSVVTESDTQNIQIRRNATSGIALLGFRINTTDNNSNFAEIRGVRTNRETSTDTDLQFFTSSSDSLTQKMRIRDDGLVGINETTLSAQLQVKSGVVDRIGLIVDTTNATPTHTADLQVWRTNGTNVARMGRFGTLHAVQIENIGSNNNVTIAIPSTGTTISRNVNDANPALIVNLQNSSATGNVVVFQKAGSALSQISNAGIFVGQSRPTRTDITANATLALADEGKVLRVNPVTAADDITITIPKNSVVAFPVDTEIAIVRYNSGTVSIAPVDGDVTLQSKSGERKISGRYGSVALKKVATDEWVLVGSLEA